MLIAIDKIKKYRVRESLKSEIKINDEILYAVRLGKIDSRFSFARKKRFLKEFSHLSKEEIELLLKDFIIARDLVGEKKLLNFLKMLEKIKHIRKSDWPRERLRNQCSIKYYNFRLYLNIINQLDKITKKSYQDLIKEFIFKINCSKSKESCFFEAMSYDDMSNIAKYFFKYFKIYSSIYLEIYQDDILRKHIEKSIEKLNYLIEKFDPKLYFFQLKEHRSIYDFYRKFFAGTKILKRISGLFWKLISVHLDRFARYTDIYNLSCGLTHSMDLLYLLLQLFRKLKNVNLFKKIINCMAKIKNQMSDKKFHKVLLKIISMINLERLDESYLKNLADIIKNELIFFIKNCISKKAILKIKKEYEQLFNNNKTNKTQEEFISKRISSLILSMTAILQFLIKSGKFLGEIKGEIEGKIELKWFRFIYKNPLGFTQLWFMNNACSFFTQEAVDFLLIELVKFDTKIASKYKEYIKLLITGKGASSIDCLYRESFGLEGIKCKLTITELKLIFDILIEHQFAVTKKNDDEELNPIERKLRKLMKEIRAQKQIFDNKLRGPSLFSQKQDFEHLEFDKIEDVQSLQNLKFNRIPKQFYSYSFNCLT